jgi:glutathione S-transferase
MFSNAAQRKPNALRLADFAGIDIEEFPKLKEWIYAMLARPGVEAGRNVPSKHRALELAQLSAEELERMASKNSSWIQSGMAGDSKK